MGNVRLSYSDLDKSGDIDKETEIIEENNYYPFGLKHRGYNEIVNAEREHKFRFNNTELDDDFDLNLYDSKARMYDQATGRFTSIDPLSSKYYSLSPYNYVANVPTGAIDPDGKRILFINGYNSTNWFLSWIAGNKSGGSYWKLDGESEPTNSGFTRGAQDFFNDYTKISERNFIDGKSSILGNAKDRYNAGREYAKKNYDELTAGMEPGEDFNIVTHSQGAAFGSGVIDYLTEKNEHTVREVVNISSHQTQDFSVSETPTTYQIIYEYDIVAIGGTQAIKGTDIFGKVKYSIWKTFVSHASTKVADVIWKHVTNLRKAYKAGRTATKGTNFAKIVIKLGKR